MGSIPIPRIDEDVQEIVIGPILTLADLFSVLKSLLKILELLSHLGRHVPSGSLEMSFGQSCEPGGDLSLLISRSGLLPKAFHQTFHELASHFAGFQHGLGHLL